MPQINIGVPLGMTYSELVEMTKDIDLESLGIYLGKRSNMADTISCYEKDGQWVIREISERQEEYEETGSEEEIMIRMKSIIKKSKFAMDRILSRFK